MSFRPIALVVMLALALCSVRGVDAPPEAPERVPSDAEAVKLMGGYWMLAKKEPSQPFESVSLVLGADGKFTLDEVFKTEIGPLRITLKGKWWVKEGVAYGQFLESSHPDIAPAGYMTVDTILRLNERIMELRTKEGDIERWEKNSG